MTDRSRARIQLFSNGTVTILQRKVKRTAQRRDQFIGVEFAWRFAAIDEQFCSGADGRANGLDEDVMGEEIRDWRF